MLGIAGAPDIPEALGMLALPDTPAESGIFTLLDEDGQELAVDGQGFDHFA